MFPHTSFNAFLQPKELQTLFVNGTANKGTPHLGYLHHNASFPFMVGLSARHLLGYLLYKEVMEAFLRINVLRQVVGVFEGILNNLLHGIGVLLTSLE